MYPILYNINSIEIKSSTVLIFFWIIIFWIYLKKSIIKNRLSIDFLDDHFLYLTISFLFFWRLGDVFLNWQVYQENLLSILYIWDQNFSIYIWFIWLIIVLYIICILKKEKVLKWLDILIKPFLIFMLIMSFSHLLSWKDYWKPSTSLLSITFNVPEVRYTIPVHPVQIYEALWIMWIYSLLLIIWRRKRVIWVISSLWFTLFFITELSLTLFRAHQDKLILHSFFRDWIEFHIVLFWSLATIFATALILKSHRHVY